MGAFVKELLARHVPPVFLSENVRNALARRHEFRIPSPYVPPLLYMHAHYVKKKEKRERGESQDQPAFTFAKKRKDGSYMPQNIAHRGNKAKHPENTMAAFKSAVNSGIHAIETDIHVTRDNVLVLSHDATLKRCFGRDEAVIDCDWEFIGSLRTLKAPHEQMPRLVDLLEFLATEEDLWVLLDIKLDVDPRLAMSLIAQAIGSVKPHPRRTWDKRILLGVWSAKYLPLCKRYLPTFPVTYIGYSTLYGRQFFCYPSVCFNMLGQILLLWPTGEKFIKDAHARNRSVLVWTVNDDKMMRWSIKNGLDGVITDDPARYREVCEEWTAGKREIGLTWKEMASAMWINFLALTVGFIFIQWRTRQRKKYHWAEDGTYKAVSSS